MVYCPPSFAMEGHMSCRNLALLSLGLPALPSCADTAGNTAGNTIEGTHFETEIIAAGSFTMGCTDGAGDCLAHESPAHEVTLSRAFHIGRTEVTQEQYEATMGSTPSHWASCGADCPVETVTWHMAADFARTLSALEGLEECYACSGTGRSTECSPVGDPYACGGYRLPTEAEWEYAARCGEDTLYAGSDDIDRVAWSADTTTHPVATKAPNGCGLYDMSGNVIEWIEDWYGSSYYAKSPGTDPKGPSIGSARVTRGGSWRYDAEYSRLAFRGYDVPGNWHSDFGFRLARTAL